MNRNLYNYSSFTGSALRRNGEMMVYSTRKSRKAKNVLLMIIIFTFVIVDGIIAESDCHQMDFVRLEKTVESGDTAKAIEHLMNSVKNTENDKIEFLREGIKCYFARQYDSSAEKLKIASDSHDEAVRFVSYLYLARSYGKMKRHGVQAMNALRRAFAICPENIEANYIKFKTLIH